jgi:hypothetical protein
MAIDVGKYLFTAAWVNPGHDWKKPCLIALSQDVLVGLNAVACKNLTSSGILCVLYALLQCCVLAAGCMVGLGSMGIRHSPVWLSLSPSRMVFSLCLTTTLLWSNSAVHPASRGDEGAVC